MIHRFNVDPIEFHNIKRHFKFYDIRINDREYRIGDTIVYKELEDFGLSGEEVKREVSYLETKAEGLQDGYVILSIISKDKKNKSHKYSPRMKKSKEELLRDQ